MKPTTNLSSGVQLEHASSSTMEIYWNILFSNAMRAGALGRLLSGGRVRLLRSEFEDAFVRTSSRVHNAIAGVRQFAAVDAPPLLSEYIKLDVSRGKGSRRYCRKCAELGVHSIAFLIEHYRYCPFHHVPLTVCSNASPPCRPRYSPDERRKVVDVLDTATKSALTRLVRIEKFLMPIEPMRDARGPVNDFVWGVSKIVHDAGALDPGLAKQQGYSVISLDACSSAAAETTKDSKRAISLYYREVIHAQKEFSEQWHEHLEDCQIRESLHCGVCNGFGTYFDRIASPGCKSRIRKWMSSSLWPSPVHEEEWLLSPIIENWIAPNVRACQLTEPDIQRILRHELLRLGHAHLLRGLSQRRFIDESLRKALFLEVYNCSWPGACLVTGPRRHIVLPNQTARDVLDKVSEARFDAVESLPPRQLRG